MDPQVRQPLSRTPSTTMQQSQPPYSNMSPYSMSYQTSQPHLPPIQSHQSQPSQNHGYVPQQYRPEQSRYPPSSSAAPYGSDRYPYAHQTSQAGPGASLLPQPGQQYPPPNPYTPPSSVSQSYPTRIAPAPPRDSNSMPGGAYNAADGRPMWTGGEAGPNAGADPSKDQRTHVVGSQGRRGILPSAPGRAPAVPNGNGTGKSNAIPAKDADGKFPCPNCNKTYLHAKHLKRHLLRHTGDRPYMCVLCKDTFSRSDILKRHFQKCSIRRGNPTGASHLSNPAAHIKKHQAAQQKAASEAAAAANSGTNTPTSGVNGYPATTASMPHQPNYSEGQSMPYPMAGNNPANVHRPGTEEQFHQSSTSGGWNQFSQAKHNPMLYQSTASPDHFAVNTSHADEKRAGVPAAGHHPGEEWHAMFQPGQNDGYMNTMFPTSMGQSYDSMAAHSDVKNESHEPPAANTYYMGPDGNPQRTK